jgi:AbrB family looped-hinge helix DNA binding protein
MVTIKIGNRGQITIPRLIRRQIGLKPGDSIALIPQGDQVVLRPVKQTLVDLRGSVEVSGTQDFDAIRGQVLAEHGAGASDRER